MCARCVCMGEEEREREIQSGSKMPSRNFQSQKSWTFLHRFAFGGGAEGDREGGGGVMVVKAVVIETRPNQTHFHFYQFAPPKMLIR